jgi:hypothetical protein
MPNEMASFNDPTLSALVLLTTSALYVSEGKHHNSVPLISMSSINQKLPKDSDRVLFFCHDPSMLGIVSIYYVSPLCLVSCNRGWLNLHT